jgi:predicted enzyme related to lactoylglutathione lyase
MPERDGYIPGVPSWVDTSHPDPEAAAAFYAQLFGWTCEDVMPADAPAPYFIARIRGGDVAGIGSVPEGAPPMAMWNTYVSVESADETAAKVNSAGGKVLVEPFDVMEAGRMAVFQDPEGAVFSVWEPKQHKGARIVNEHGSLNFNNLNTRDVEGARSFYASVFGWQITSFNGFQTWTLPGYGDHLEATNPGLRKQVAEMGVPGFEDVVAAIIPIADDQDEVPAHWSVTFAVDDAAAIAEKTTELRGRVIVPPFDAPWVRSTVIADPQGATFIANQFVPENKDIASRADASAAAS